MDKISCMQAFVAVANAGGFSSAARKSFQSKALLSKYIANLEDTLGIRLFNRTTRHVSLTDIGKAYYDRCLPLLEELEDLELSLQDTHKNPSGNLNITAPVSFSELHLMAAISEFTKQYPEIQINLTLTDKAIDIIENNFHLALRIGALEDSSLIARRLSTVQIVVCASKQYLKKHGTPKTPKDLRNHSCIVDTNYKHGIFWPFEKNKKTEKVNIQGHYYVNSAIAAKELALAHCGISLCPTFVLGNAIQTNKLKVLFPDYQIESFGLYAVYSHRKHLSTKVQLFINLLKAHFKPTINQM